MSRQDLPPGLNATLEQPIPVRGLQEQHLGVVRRVRMRLDSGRVDSFELQTRWQTIRLRGDTLRFSRTEGVFYLRPSASSSAS